MIHVLETKNLKNMENEGRSISNTVMVAIEESECSHYALQWTLDNLHDSLSDSKLIILTVQPMSDYAYAYTATLGDALPELIYSIQETYKKIAEALLEKAKNICADHGITVETITEIGEPKETICAAVDKLDVKLLILGSHDKVSIKRSFLGSVSNFCVHNANCPVLVVRKSL